MAPRRSSAGEEGSEVGLCILVSEKHDSMLNALLHFIYTVLISTIVEQTRWKHDPNNEVSRYTFGN